MSMHGRLKDQYNKKQNSLNSADEVRDLINSASSKALKQFLQRMENGEIPIDNVSDFMRVVGIYKEINEISTALDGKATQAAFPELNMRQEKVLNDMEDSGQVSTNEEDRVELSDMSDNEVADMLRNLDIAQNKSNEESF